MGRKLILTDLDGTIVPFGSMSTSAAVIDAFHAAQDAGHVAGPVSGRAICMLPETFGGDERCYQSAVTSNGHQVWHEGKRLMRTMLSWDGLRRVHDVVDGLEGVRLVILDHGSFGTVGAFDEALEQGFPEAASTYEPIGLGEGLVEQAGLVVVGGYERANGLRDRLARLVPEFDYAVSQERFVDVLAPGVNKASGVLWLRDHLGIAPEDVYVFGDAGNDIEMLEAVENSVAVAGATPEAAAAARWHIGSVEEDAVASAILSIVETGFIAPELLRG